MDATVLFVLVSAPALWLVHWLMSLDDPYDEPVFWSAFTLSAFVGLIPSRGRTFALCSLVLLAAFVCLGPWLKLLRNPLDDLDVGVALGLGLSTGKGMSCWSRRCPQCGRFNAMTQAGNSLINLIHDVVPPRPERIRLECRHCGHEAWQERHEEA